MSASILPTRDGDLIHGGHPSRRDHRGNQLWDEPVTPPFGFKVGFKASTLCISFVCLAALMTGCSNDARQPGAQRATEKMPNILFIVTDDQRPDSFGVMPSTRRWFKKGGTDFKNAFVTTPLCCPSRATIFSGRYAHNHQVRRENEEAFDESGTMQQYLDEAGYRTGIYGKFLNGWLKPDPSHFDDFAIFPYSVGGYRDNEWNINGVVGKQPQYSTYLIARKAERFLDASEQQDDQPWFLYAAAQAPHCQCDAIPRDRDAPVPKWKGNPSVFESDRSVDPGGRSDKPPYLQKDPPVRFKDAQVLRTKQLRTLPPVDDLVRRVMDKIRSNGEDERTLAIYLSDNGFLWGEHGRAQKSVPYLPSIRVPLMMRWPGRIDAGVTDDRLVANVDLLPTVLDAVGLDPEDPDLMDGHSILDRSWSRERLFTEFFKLSYYPVPTWASITTKTMQYTEYYRRDDPDVPTFTEYYDLTADPWQLHNLMVESADGVPDPAGLSKDIKGYRSCHGGECP